MTVDELLNINIAGRLSSIELNFANFANMFDDYTKKRNSIPSQVQSFKEVETRLNERMLAIEEFIKSIAELSYKGGFYKPDKKNEQQIINRLKKEIQDKDNRIAEFENTFKTLMGK